MKADQPVASVAFRWRGAKIGEQKRSTKDARLSDEQLVALCDWTKLERWLVPSTLGAVDIPAQLVSRGALTADGAHWVAMDADTIRLDLLLGMLRAGALSWTENINST